MIHCPDGYEDFHPASFALVTDLISEQKNAYGIGHGLFEDRPFQRMSAI
jgi:hypothetical protein